MAVGVFYRWYFSVRTRGIEHVPTRGRAMLVGNHSGGIAIDAAMVVHVVPARDGPARLAQGMAEKFINRVPFLGEWASRTGHLTGLPEHAERLLEDDRLLLVFPEGRARHGEAVSSDRNSLVDFGSGFVRLALKTKTPIVPFAVLGGGEAFPTVANAYKLGRAFGAALRADRGVRSPGAAPGADRDRVRARRCTSRARATRTTRSSTATSTRSKRSSPG